MHADDLQIVPTSLYLRLMFVRLVEYWNFSILELIFECQCMRTIYKSIPHHCISDYCLSDWLNIGVFQSLN